MDVVVGEGERRDSCASSHFVLAHLPVHCFSGTPGDSHFFGYAGPHVCFESVISKD